MKITSNIIRAFFCMGICVSFLSTGNAQISDMESNALDQLIADNVAISADIYSSKKISAVCTAQFFKVKQVPKYRSDGMYNEILLMKTSEGYSELQYAEDLLPIINSDFYLTNKKDASKFEALLDELYPVFSQSAKQILQNENQWIFVRSDSWGEKEGTIVTVDADGKIVQIASNQTIE